LFIVFLMHSDCQEYLAKYFAAKKRNDSYLKKSKQINVRIVYHEFANYFAY